MSIESVIPYNNIILCHPLLPLPPVFPSIRVFSSELALYIRWPKYWSFSFSISPSSEYSGLISFRIDWFDLLDVQVTLKSLLQSWKLLNIGKTKSNSQGFPWWLSGKQSTCKFRKHGFNPLSGKIPHAAEQLSPCATATEPVLWSPGAATMESHNAIIEA